MNKRKRIKQLEAEVQREGDVIWRIFNLLCDEYDVALNVAPKHPAQEEPNEQT